MSTSGFHLISELWQPGKWYQYPIFFYNFHNRKVWQYFLGQNHHFNFHFLHHLHFQTHIVNYSNFHFLHHLHFQPHIVNYFNFHLLDYLIFQTHCKLFQLSISTPPSFLATYCHIDINYFNFYFQLPHIWAWGWTRVWLWLHWGACCHQSWYRSSPISHL